jgi:AbrB family looped-hinge helix DNA binding protein
MNYETLKSVGWVCCLTYPSYTKFTGCAWVFSAVAIVNFYQRLYTLYRNSAYAEKQTVLEDTMSEQVQVRQRGTLTIPAALRERYGIRAGDTLNLVDLDGVFVLTPMVPMVPELAREIERLRVEAGVSVEELLQGLREQRQQSHQEQGDSHAGNT